ncbi:hypothetical protein MN116_006357 [Schistosoma mekongi]|uniref:Solute carrier family 46 member 3 n=1 Tax=Schistosoma mekongi TaxID=38744 RepID=A0AAE1ZAS5_SCHME|nr:hypothetical protein MN116_006357 [Schistosoma mekongi]
MSETILQYATRIEIYQMICIMWINSTKLQQNLCYNDKQPTIQSVNNNNNNVNDTINNENELLTKIQQTSAYYLLIYRILLNLPAMITCFIYGSYSNKYGCKLSMLIPCIGAIIAYYSWLFLGVIIGSASAYITTSIRSIISKLMHTTDINASFALISILEIISNLFGSLLFTLIYNYTLNYMSSFTLLFDALLHCLLLLVFLWVRYKLIELEKQNQQEEEEHYQYIDN